MFKAFVVLVIGVFLVGCTVAYKQPQIDLRSRSYPTSTTIDPKNVTKNVHYRDITRVKFVVLRTDSNNNPAGHRQFMEGVFRSLGFSDVLDDAGFAQRIIGSGMKVSGAGTYDLLTLHEIAKELGPFLVVDAGLWLGASTNWRNYLKITDPEMPDVLVSFDYTRLAFLSVESEFVYPTANFIRDWYLASK